MSVPILMSFNRIDPAVASANGTVVIAWLEWQLKGNVEAGETYNSEPCGLYREAEWSVKRKHWK